MSVAGGGWWRRGDGRRDAARAARDAAQQAFYELDSTQREAELAVETVKAAGDERTARQAVAEFQQLGARVNEVTVAYLGALDAQDLDDEELDGARAEQARQGLSRAEQQLNGTKGELTAFMARLQPVIDQAESRLMRVTPAVAQAKQALLGATTALEQVRTAGLKADDLAARLAQLAPELTKLNEGAGRHGVEPTLQRAEDVRLRADAVRIAAEQLPEKAREIDRRVGSLRTRIQALETKAGTVEPALSELRRGFSAACWQDLQQVPEQAEEAVRTARAKLTEATGARDEQRWPDATGAIGTVRAVLDEADGRIAAVHGRVRQLKEVAHDPQREIEQARFAIRDAQRLAMAGRQTPDPRHAAPLDAAVARLDRAVAALEESGRHPDYWHFLTELAGVKESAAGVVAMIRGTHA
ncbi:hypothetical protein ACIRBX_12810 [Kitasatospora sp. NPDC096147]|uniref:hypothetical protein n=1 Tax=Kitasatospora sp. NPDC096147 TaxID=3364093 RepID=UPI00380DEA3B